MRAAAWHRAQDVRGDTFPCGHALLQENGELMPWAVVRGQADCPKCGGEGDVLVWKSPAAWARQDVREARQKKQAAVGGSESAV